MASASAGLELPATSLIAPLLVLGRIAVSWREAPLPRALITRRRQGWQYDGPPGPGFVPVDSGSLGAARVWPHGPLPRLRGRDREGGGRRKENEGHAKRIKRARSPPPQPSPACGGGSTSSLLRATVRARWR